MACDDARVNAERDHAPGGLWLAIAGTCCLPLTIAIVGIVPQSVRGGVFVCGLGVTATLALWGGWRSRRAIGTGAAHPIAAAIGAILGLVVGATAALLACWSLVGLVL